MPPVFVSLPSPIQLANRSLASQGLFLFHDICLNS